MIEGCNATSDHDTAKLTTTVWHNRGDAAPWQVICDFGLCAQDIPHLSPHTVGVRTRVLAEPFLSPQRCTGWIGKD